MPYFSSPATIDGSVGLVTSDTMKRSGIKPNTSIRIDPEALHQARVAAVIDRKTLGQWLEEAIKEKVEREKGRNDVTETDS